MVADPDKPTWEETFISKVLAPLIIGVFTLILLIGIAALVPVGHTAVYHGDTREVEGTDHAAQQ